MKLYADEPGCDLVRGLSNLVVSQLARVEVPAAIWRKHRLGELSAEDAAVLVDAFESDWFGNGLEPAGFAVVAAGERVLESAARAVAVHPLRGYDGVQLASALAARAADPDLRAFVCFDRALATAARAEGFDAVP